MRSPARRPGRTRGPRARVRAARKGLLALAVLAVTTGCDASFGWPKAITPQGERMRNDWIGACIAACVVGAFVVVLIGYAVVAYRKRDEALPRQVRYNLPIEILYTVVPFVIVAALFYYTARDEIYVFKKTKNPAAHGVTVIDVEGNQWGWTFRYLSDSGKVGVPATDAIFVTGSSNTSEPTLVLPTGTPIQFQEHSNNVIHSFWVPELLFKLDVVPGRTNTWQVSTINRVGEFRGHCAELCGYDHARMNFTLKTVSPADYRAWLLSMRDHTEPIPGWVSQTTPAGSIT